MRKRIIHVDHQLLRLSDMQYVITQTKTDCGIRNLPMTQGVYECFQRILKARRRPKVEPMIDNKIIVTNKHIPEINLENERLRM